jgi:glycosyltransferase involved in cell wall biosynthesis
MESTDLHFKRYQGIQSRLILGDLQAIPSPLVTIAIPTFRRADLLKEAIGSALAQVDVAFPYEVIVVDDAAEDVESETTRLIQRCHDPRLLYYRNEKNLGMFGNWNRFVELARGRWVVMLHDDDILSPFYLKMIAPLISVGQPADIMLFDLLHFSGPVPVFPEFSPAGYQNAWRFTSADHLLGNLAEGVVGPLFRREAFLRSGGFDERYFPSADYEYWARASRLLRLVKYPDLVAGGYRHLVNESANPNTQRGTRLQDARIKMQVLSLVKSPARRWILERLVVGLMRKGWPKHYRRLFQEKQVGWPEFCQATGIPTRWPESAMDRLIAAGLRRSLLKWLIMWLFPSECPLRPAIDEKVPD